MIVCHCRVVTDGDLRDAVAEGARSVSAACAATGAGSGCGTCVFSVKALVCDHLSVEFQRLEAEGAAS